MLERNNPTQLTYELFKSLSLASQHILIRLGRDIGAGVSVLEKDLRAYIVDSSIGIKLGDFDAAVRDLVGRGLLDEACVTVRGKLEVTYVINKQIEQFIENDFARITQEQELFS